MEESHRGKRNEATPTRRTTHLRSAFHVRARRRGGVRQLDGSYTGAFTVEATAGGIGTITVTGSMRMIAEQDGDRVTLSGSMTLAGETEALGSIPGTIDEGGVWTEFGSETGAFVTGDDECGYTGESRVRFSGDSLRFEISASRLTPTIDCPNIRMSADLPRTCGPRKKEKR